MTDDLTVKNIRSAIVSTLEAVTYQGSSAFAQVVGYPTILFTGLPAVSMSPTANLSDYQTIVSNFRSYVFDVSLFVSMEDTAGGAASAWPVMEVLYANALRAIDNSDSLQNTVEIVRPATSIWQPVTSPMGELLEARLTVTAGLSVDTNNG